MKKVGLDKNFGLSIGRLIRATRKHLGVNQTTVAPLLGLDQSAFSRVESGKQVLTAMQWLVFCNYAGICPSSALTGLIELKRIETAIRLPSRYSFSKHTKVRSLLPLLAFASSSLGQRQFNSFLEEKKIDPDFFVNLEAKINFNFKLDLLAHLVKKIGITGKDAALITRSAGEADMHGSLHFLYDRLHANQVNLVASWVTKSEFYDSDFKYEVVDSAKNQLDVSVTPSPHFKEFDYRGVPALEDVLAQYDKGFFENFSAYGGQKPLKVMVLENHYKGSSQSLYRLKSAAS